MRFKYNYPNGWKRSAGERKLAFDHRLIVRQALNRK